MIRTSVIISNGAVWHVALGVITEATNLVRFQTLRYSIIWLLRNTNRDFAIIIIGGSSQYKDAILPV